MRKKEDYIKRLHESPLFRAALAKAENEEQAERIAKLTEAFVARFATAMEKTITQVESDPNFKAKLRKALIERGRVVTSEPNVSGSKD